MDAVISTSIRPFPGQDTTSLIDKHRDQILARKDAVMQEAAVAFLVCEFELSTYDSSLL